MYKNISYKPLSAYADILTVDDIREIFRIGKNTAYDLLNSGDIEVLKIGKQIRIPKINLLKYIYKDKYKCYDSLIGGIAIDEGGNASEG